MHEPPVAQHGSTPGDTLQLFESVRDVHQRDTARLEALAQELGAKKPMRVPRFIGRLFAGEAGVVMMTEVRGASNAKAKRELEWRPAHPSWRQGFAAT